MRTNNFAVGLGILFAVTLALPSCGDDGGDDQQSRAGSSNQSGAAGRAPTGGGGSAGSAPTGPVVCGSELCPPLAFPPVPACCADAATSQCGLDTAALSGFGAEPGRACEPLNQPGELDADCPNSVPFQVEGNQIPSFPGCCSETTGRCGYLVDSVGGIFAIGLGCVDSSPFLDGAMAPSCNAGSGTGGAPSGAGGSPD